MAHSPDWIPRPEHEFVDLTVFGWEASDCTKVLLAISAFISAREEYEARLWPISRGTACCAPTAKNP
jgi:hypothetical protein